MAETIKPTVYLIKQDITDPDDIFKDAGKLLKLDAEEGWLYYIPSQPHPPKWLPFIAGHFKVDKKLFLNASAYAVIVQNVDDRYFVIPFGMGSHLINMARIEHNFGLRVAINTVPRGDLRQMDLTTPEATSQKTKKQAVKESTPEELGVNKQKDILRGLVGKLPKDHALGKRIEGKDSVKVTKHIEDLGQLKELCRALLSASASNDYKKDYSWIDKMAIICDPVLIQELFDKLIQAIRDREFDHMYISTPQFIDNLYEYDGFVFTGDRKRAKGKTSHEFPTMDDLAADLGEEFMASLDRETLSRTCRVCLRDAEGELAYGWPLSRCLVWESEKDGNKYILSEGDWYKIDAQFYGTVDQFFRDHCDDLNLPKAAGNKIRESEYNAAACDVIKGLYLFDLGHKKAKQKHITSDHNEICDIFDANKKRFIHVKMGKSSSDISHLLRQGVFSGTALKSDGEALEKFKEYLRKDGCPADDVIKMPYTPSDYEIVFAVVLDEKQGQDIPFFSKVSFRDTAELTLEMMGYKCRFGFITRSPALTNAEPANDIAA